jgi:N-acetylmuramate 1-kinase
MNSDMHKDRPALIDEFLDTHGWGDAARATLAGDASFRHYDRLVRGDERAVLMDAPPPDEDVRPFVAIARYLSEQGFSAPDIIATDEDAGLLLLEDLGDDTYTRMLATDGDEAALYALAVDVLISLHKCSTRPEGLLPYGNGRLLDEAFLAPVWLFDDIPLSEPVRREYGDAWLELFPHVHATPKVLVLRDYHVDNLIWLAGRNETKACGLLDFQDAVLGSVAYDLMSLLQDARRDIDPDLKAAMIERYTAAFPDLDRDAFDLAFTVLAAQRHAKVIGIFTRLDKRDGKPDYLAHLPRVWRLLEAALEHPRLSRLKSWFDEHMPPRIRGEVRK